MMLKGCLIINKKTIRRKNRLWFNRMALFAEIKMITVSYLPKEFKKM